MRALAALAFAAPLAGCATAVAPPAAVTSYAAPAGCAAAPDLRSAIGMTPAKRKRLHSVSTPVGAGTPCLQWKEARGPHVVYALPEDRADRLVEIGAALEGARIFSPAVTTLDAAGREVRAFPADQFLIRGNVLSVQFVPRPEERYALVSADPARMGQGREDIAISTTTAATYTGFGVATWTSGHDRASSRDFSYEGMVLAFLHDRMPDGK